MSIEEFACEPCDVQWRDKYSFWRGYHSLCPRCGKARPASRDVRHYADRAEIDIVRFGIDGPLFESEESGTEKTEADLEAERDQIHDEIAEALGSVGATTDVDSDVDGDGADAGDGDAGDR